jgi:t-SNARE complex subunit (syntaxin)
LLHEHFHQLYSYNKPKINILKTKKIQTAISARNGGKVTAKSLLSNNPG